MRQGVVIDVRLNELEYGFRLAAWYPGRSRIYAGGWTRFMKHRQPALYLFKVVGQGLDQFPIG